MDLKTGGVIRVKRLAEILCSTNGAKWRHNLGSSAILMRNSR